MEETLIKIIQKDLHSRPPYMEYDLIMKSYEMYVNMLVPSTKKWSPQAIRSNTDKLCHLMTEISNYPSVDISDKAVYETHQVFCQGLNLKTSEELNIALLFALKADPRAE